MASEGALISLLHDNSYLRSNPEGQIVDKGLYLDWTGYLYTLKLRRGLISQIYYPDNSTIDCSEGIIGPLYEIHVSSRIEYQQLFSKYYYEDGVFTPSLCSVNYGYTSGVISSRIYDALNIDFEDMQVS